MWKAEVTTGRSGTLWPAVLKAVEASRAASRRTVLYVPEQLTLQTERDLISQLQLKGLLDIDVVSPRKMRLRIRESAGAGKRKTLDETGKILAVHRAMAEAAGDLRYYRNMTELPGAVGRIREALSELQESGMTPEELEQAAVAAAGGAQQAKMEDLEHIWKALDALVSEHFIDDRTAWTDMVNRLEKAEFLRGADLLVYGFDSIRPDMRELLVQAARVTEKVHVFLISDEKDAPDRQLFEEPRRSLEKLCAALEEAGAEVRKQKAAERMAETVPALAHLEKNLFAGTPAAFREDPGDALRLYAAPGPDEEAEKIAACLQSWHREGIPWEQMAIAMPRESGLAGAIRSRLELSGIPFYTAEQTPAAAHGACRMLLGALNCISGGYSAEDAAGVARSGFCTLTAEEGLFLETYARARGIEGSRWRQPFRKGKDAEKAEAIRRKFLAPIEALREDLKKAKTGAGSAEALARFLDAEGAYERLQEREERLLEDGMYREAVADRQVWKLLMELLEQMWTLLGERRVSMRELKNMLESALYGISVTTLPETEEGVVLGGIGHMLTEDLRALVVPGLQEGIMTVPESGWLQDPEREALEKASGREIGISRERRGWIRQYDYYRTLTLPSRFLLLTRSLRDDTGAPCPEDGLIGRIRTVFPRLREEGGVAERESAGRPETPMKALEGLGEAIIEEREDEKDTWGEAMVSLLHDDRFSRTVQSMISRAREEEPAQILPETAGRLFRTDTVSISRLERYAACPYRHFIDYGLRPVHRETFDFEDSDAGTFFHAALDQFMKDAGGEPEWPDLAEERVDGIMNAVCAELTQEWEEGPLREDALGIWQGEEYLRRVRYAARVLTRFAANSDFRTIATEKSFGEPDGLPPLVLHLADGSKAAVRGTIDRIDTYRNGEGVWLRVVDNKSGYKKPDPARMADGEQLQLMIYLKAATEAYPEAQPAGALYFPVQDAEVSGTTPEEAEEERLKKVRMKGVVTAEEDVVRAMDRDRSPWSVDAVFNKDGSVSKKAPWAVEKEVMEGLMDSAEQKAAELCQEIRSGRVEATPRGTEEESVCRYCTYRTICHVRRDSGLPRDPGITYRDAAGKNTLRDMEKKRIITTKKNP